MTYYVKLLGKTGFDREDLLDAKGVGVELPNGMRVEVEKRSPNMVQVYTADGRLLVDMSTAASNTMGLLCVHNRERVKVVDPYAAREGSDG